MRCACCRYDANGDGELDVGEFESAIKGRVLAALEWVLASLRFELRSGLVWDLRA